jgi:hypothetical protein
MIAWLATLLAATVSRAGVGVVVISFVVVCRCVGHLLDLRPNPLPEIGTRIAGKRNKRQCASTR